MFLLITWDASVAETDRAVLAAVGAGTVRVLHRAAVASVPSPLAYDRIRDALDNLAQAHPDLFFVVVALDDSGTLGSRVPTAVGTAFAAVTER